MLTNAPLLRLLSLLLALLLAACQQPSAGGKPTGTAPSAELAPPRYAPGPWRVTLLGDHEVEFLGEISKASMAELQQVLVTHPDIKVLQLTSPGGDRRALKTVLPTILSQDRTTFVPLLCASACAELFLAGKHRLLGEDAAIAFHQSRVVALTGALDAQYLPQIEAAANEDLKQSLIGSGVAAEFAERVVATPHEALWFPSAEELTAGGIVTERVAAGRFAAPSTGADPSTLLDWGLFGDAVSVAYRAAYPDDYARVRTQIWQDIHRQGFADGVAFELMLAAIRDAVGPSLGVATDRAAADFWRAMLAAIAYLDRRQPMECFRMLNGGYVTDSVLGNDDENRLVAHFESMLVALFDSLAHDPRQRPPSLAEHEDAFELLATRMVDAGSIDEIDATVLAKPELYPERYCSVLGRLLSASLAMPQPTQSVLLRSLMLHY
jgi:hypothetical protein